MKILIVEDELIIALAMRDILTAGSHQIGILARDERQAMLIAGTFKPDLALVDWELAHGCFGGAVAHGLWQRFGVRSIFVSGYPRACHEVGYDLGVVGCISKPFSPEQLIDAVDAAAAVSRQELPLRMPANLVMYSAPRANSLHIL